MTWGYLQDRLSLVLSTIPGDIHQTLLALGFVPINMEEINMEMSFYIDYRYFLLDLLPYWKQLGNNWRNTSHSKKINGKIG